MPSLFNIICTRRTIRRFKQTPLSKNVFKKLITAAQLAPSGSNLQPCRYIIIDKPELLKSIFPLLKWAGYISPHGTPKDGEEPVAYVIVLANLTIKRKGSEIDAAACIQNILLTAWEDGIGSCWLQSIHRKKIKKLLRIPHHLKVDSIVALGYPDENPVVEKVTDSIKYWKNRHGVLHVPKYSLPDICYVNGYGNKNRWQGS